MDEKLQENEQVSLFYDMEIESREDVIELLKADDVIIKGTPYLKGSIITIFNSAWINIWLAMIII